MSTFWYNEKFRRPTISFTDTLMKGAQGMYREKDEYAPFMYRALVIAVDVYGGKLESADGEPEGGPAIQEVRDAPKPAKALATYSLSKINIGPRNPKNSVKARIISNNMDLFIADDDLRVFWPMFPGLDSPSPGEVVYVVFEDSDLNHGLWLARVPLNGDHETKNQILKGAKMTNDKVTGKSTYFANASNSTSTTAGGLGQRTNYVQDPYRLTRYFINI